MCGFINFVRAYLQGKPITSGSEIKPAAKKEEVSGESKDGEKKENSQERKKAALDILDEEISQQKLKTITPVSKPEASFSMSEKMDFA